MVEIDYGLLFLNLCLTIAIYCLYPLLVANKTEKEMTRKKYAWKCFGFNFIVWICLFIFQDIVYGKGNGGGAYMIWTWVFEAVGRNKLRERGLLIEKKRKSVEQKPTEAISVEQKPAAVKSVEQKPVAVKPSSITPDVQGERGTYVSYKEQFIRTMMEESGFSYAACEEAYNIDTTFMLHGKEAGINRMHRLEDTVLSVNSIEKLAPLISVYSFICGYMVPLGHLTKAESDQMSKSFVEKLQRVTLELMGNK